MTSALVYLSLRTLRNRLISQARRLRRPRYFLFAVIGGAYLYYAVVRHWLIGFTLAAEAGPRALPADLLELIAVLMITASIPLAWCAQTPGSALPFTQAEVTHLFPAPLSRQSLLRWKVMKGQLGALLSVVIFAMVSGPYLAGGRRVTFLMGAWVVFSTMQLHMTGIRMARHSLQRRGIGWSRRAVIAGVVSLAGVAACGLWIVRHGLVTEAVTMASLERPEDLGRLAVHVLGSGPALFLTYPARLLARPALADSAQGFLAASVPALGLLLLNYVWVMKSDAVLEEGALEAAGRREHRRRARGGSRAGPARRPRRAPPPFELSAAGRPEVALIWKNLICLSRGLGGIPVWLLLAGGGSVPLSLVLLAALRGEGFAIAAGILCGAMALVLVLAGPSMLRSDFRQELPHMDMLKTYPIRGRAIVAATVLVPVLILTVVEWALLAAAGLLVGAAGSGGSAEWLVQHSLALALAGMILAPFSLIVSGLVHNAAILIAPAWMAFGASGTTAVERIGQAMLGTLGLALSLALFHAPAVLLLVFTWLSLGALVGNAAALPLAACAGALALAGEALLGLFALGAFLERFDPSAELNPL